MGAIIGCVALVLLLGAILSVFAWGIVEAYLLEKSLQQLNQARRESREIREKQKELHDRRLAFHRALEELN